MQYFNIQVASQLSGVASATIRAWEKRYGAVHPERGENQHRLYSEKDIEKLAILCKLTELGQSIGKIARLDLEELKHIYSTLLHRPYDEKQVVTPHHDRVDFQKMLMNFQIALAAYKLDIISHELDKAKMLLGPRDLCLSLLIPLFQQIGMKVEKTELTVAQEHTLSSIFSFHLGHMIGMHYQRENLRKELILITAPEGERHQIGLLGAALLCIHHNYPFIFLGPDLPADSLAETANALKPSYILLGVTKGHELSENLTVNDYLDNLMETMTARTSLLVGGNLNPSEQSKLRKKGVSFFPTLQTFDQFLLSKN